MKKLLLISATALLSFQAGAQGFDNTFDGDGWRQDTIGSGLSSGQSYYDAITQSDNKLVVSGLYKVTNLAQDVSLVRYNTDGSMDNSFGTNGKVFLTLNEGDIPLSNIAQNTSGELFVLGSHSSGSFSICKLSPNGTIISSFGVNGVIKDSTLTSTQTGFEDGNDITIQADGKILVAGYYRRSAPTTEHAAWVIRYNTDGTRDNNFGTNGMVTVIGGDNRFNKLLIQPDGKILAGGCSGLMAQQQQDWMVARLNTDGTMDNSFGGLQNGVVTIGMQYHEAVKDMDLQSDGSIIIGGACGNGNVTFRIIKLTAGGLNDANFGTDVQGTTNWGYTKVELQTFTDHWFAGLAVLPNDKIVIGGTVSNFKFAAIRFDANGDPDNTFGTNSVVDSQLIGGIGMRGSLFSEGTGRFYVLGGVVDQNEGIAYSAITAVNVAAPNSVKEVAGTKKLSIYPNPVNGVLHMESIEGNILVQDISGRRMLSAQGKDIDVSQLSTGMYFIKCITKDGTVYTGQFVKN